MRKTLSIILCVMMLLSACSFAISTSAAPEGTAINTADEFMAMVSTPADATEPTAKYYLASDITLAATYAEPFWGILDGNGKTLTVTNPVFADFSGEVSNLTIKGEIYYTDADAAGFAVASSRGYKATKVTNNANVTVMGNGKHIGGFSARIVNNKELGIPAECWFVDCVNNGNLYIDSTADEKMRAGGFSGILDLSHFANCVNNGNIYMKGNICIGAGFVGRVALTAGMNGAEAFSCVNNGNVVVEDTYTSKDGTVGAGTAGADAGGIFGYIGGSGNAGWYKIWGCTNNGDVTGPYRVGGMVGYVYASGSTAFVDIQFCINAGNLTYGRIAGGSNTTTTDFCGPFVGYTNSPFTTIKYSIDTGTINLVENSISVTDGKVFVGLSSADGSQYDIKGVYVLNKEQYKWMTWAVDDKNAANRHGIEEAEGIFVTTLEDIKSGKVAYLINEAAVKDDYGYAMFDSDDYAWAGFKSGDAYAFTQKLGTDNYPAGNTGSANWVVLNGDKYENGEKGTAATTEAPETQAPETQAPETQAPETQAPETQAPETQAPTTQAPETQAPAEKGCGGMIAGGVAIIAILGTALIIKKED